jgi:hypothetical protein
MKQFCVYSIRSFRPTVEKALLNKQKLEFKKGFEERIWFVFLCLCYCINTGQTLGLYSL